MQWPAGPPSCASTYLGYTKPGTCTGQGEPLAMGRFSQRQATGVLRLIDTEPNV
jgi:hypothetical protein